MTRDDFVTMYATAMDIRAYKDPGYALIDTTATASKMTASLAKGSVNTDSPVLRSLARLLGIPHTISSWRSFAQNLKDGML